MSQISNRLRDKTNRIVSLSKNREFVFLLAISVLWVALPGFRASPCGLGAKQENPPKHLRKIEKDVTIFVLIKNLLFAKTEE